MWIDWTLPEAPWGWRLTASHGVHATSRGRPHAIAPLHPASASDPPDVYRFRPAEQTERPVLFGLEGRIPALGYRQKP